MHVSIPVLALEWKFSLCVCLMHRLLPCLLVCQCVGAPQHFFASNDKAEDLLGWKPKFGLVEGLRDSYSLDFGRGTMRKAPDFTTDDMILEKLGISQTAGV